MNERVGFSFGSVDNAFNRHPAKVAFTDKRTSKAAMEVQIRAERIL